RPPPSTLFPYTTLFRSLQIRSDSAQIRLRLAHAHACLHPPKNLHHARLTVCDSRRTRPERARGRWHVHVIFVRVLWYWRQHTDYRMNPVVHRERLVHDCRVAAETLDPILVAEHQHGGGPGLFIFRTESAPQKRLDSKNIEVIPENHSRFHPLRLAAAQQDEIHVVVFDQAVER